MLLRPPALASLLAAALAACGDGDTPRFTTDAATGAPDAGGRTCSSNAQCDDGVACTRDLCVVGNVCENVPDSPTCMVPRRCTRAADCNDNVACTRDSCLVDGACSNTPQNEMCPAGQTCNARTGCGAMGGTGTCRADADCRDAYDCTVDSCGSDGRCVYTAQNARCAMGQVCRVGMGCIAERACARDADCDDRMRCTGVERCVEFGCQAGTPVSCDDMNACTVDACVESGPAMCTHMMNPTCMGGAAPQSGVYSLNPGVMYSCRSVLGSEVVRINMSAIQVTVTATGLTVNGAPAPMTGPPPMGGTFTVTGMVGGTCVETYSLTGRFTSQRQFTGTFSTSYAGLDCFLTDCMTRMFPVSGTLAM